MRIPGMAVLCALGLVSLASMANALELRWAAGETDLRFAEAQRCTLLLCSSGIDEQLPQEWRLAYVIEGGDGESLRLKPDFSETGTAGICWSPGEGATAADLAAHKQTVQHCSIYSTARARCARYVFGLAAGARATFRAVVVPAADSPEAPGAASEVSTNGGAAEECPPMVTRVTVRIDGDALVIEAQGDGLARVTAVRLVDDADQVSGFMTIVARTSDSVTARRSGASRLAQGRIEFRDAYGRIDAVEVPLTERRLAPLGAQDQLVIRFAPGEVEPPQGRTGGAILEQRFSSTAIRESLTTCGVLRLDRLFPWFRREDVHSKNLIGEGVILEDLSDTYVAAVSPGIDQLATCARLGQVPGILSAGVDPLLPAAHQVPTDPLWPVQWGLRSTGQTICTFTATPDVDINPEPAWARTRGLGASIAIIDAGTDGHPDITPCGDPCVPSLCPFPSCGAQLDTSFVPGDFTYRDSTVSRHGNAVASLAMARSNNAECIAGVAEDATTWAIKVVDKDVLTTPSRVSGAIDYARNKDRGIMNMSLGFPDESFGLTAGTKDALAKACLDAFYAGYLLVASTGNDNNSTPQYPAAFGKRVCAVGASDVYGGRWTDDIYRGGPFIGSTYGSWTDLIAPGGRFIVSAWVNHYIERCHDLSNCNLGAGSHIGGTSASAPIVTGVAALLKSYNLNLLGEDIEQIMIRSARDVFLPPASAGFDVYTGYGIVQASAALDSITPPKHVRQRSVGFEGTSGTLGVVDSANILISLINLPGVPGVPRQATRVRLAGTGSFGYGYQGPPTVWVRSSGTLGWDSLATFDYQQDVGWGRVNGGTRTDTSAAFETFVYRIAGTPQLWFPCRPESARVAYTTVGVVDTLAVGVETHEPAPFALTLGPNPARGRLSINFWLPHRAMVNLDVIDVAGRVVATVVNREIEGGAQRFSWDGKSRAGERSPAGVYLCRLRISGRQEVRKFASVAWPGN